MTLRATAKQENSMNTQLGVAPDRCRHCGSDVWADVRYLNWNGEDPYFCPSNPAQAHEAE